MIQQRGDGLFLLFINFDSLIYVSLFRPSAQEAAAGFCLVFISVCLLFLRRLMLDTGEDQRPADQREQVRKL